MLPQKETSDEDDGMFKLPEYLLKSMQVQTELLSNELESKNINLEVLLEEIKKIAWRADNQNNTTKNENVVIIQLHQLIEILNEKNEGLEARINELFVQIDKQLQIIEKLELENELLRAENSRFVLELKQKGRPQSTKRTEIEQRSPTKSLSLKEPEFSTQSSIIFDLLKSPENDHRSDDTCYSQFEHLKEQLESERLIVKDFETLIVNLQNNNQHLASENIKLHNENKVLAIKFDQTKQDYDKLLEIRMQDRLKLDSLITFCNLLENCNCNRLELPYHSAELPGLILNYLKGDSRAVDFRVSNHHLNGSRSRGYSKLKRLRGQIGPSPDIHNVNKSLREVKDIMSQLMQAINQKDRKKLNLTDPFALRCIENYAEDFPHNGGMSNGQRHHLKTDRFFLSNAVTCSHSFLLNLKPGGGMLFEEEDDGNISDESNISERSEEDLC